MEQQKLQVYKSIATIIGKMAVDGIGKNRRNEEQRFMFRGIDDVYNALAGMLAEEQLTIIPFLEKRESREAPTKAGGIKNYVTVEVRYEIVSAIDGSMHVARMAGEAMDSGDKATNKAMSAAYKYLCLQTFCIPTEGDNDADAHSHERVAGQASPHQQQPQQQKVPAPNQQTSVGTAPAINTKQYGKLLERVNAGDISAALAAASTFTLNPTQKLAIEQAQLGGWKTALAACQTLDAAKNLYAIHERALLASIPLRELYAAREKELGGGISDDWADAIAGCKTQQELNTLYKANAEKIDLDPALQQAFKDKQEQIKKAGNGQRSNVKATT